MIDNICFFDCLSPISFIFKFTFCTSEYWIYNFLLLFNNFMEFFCDRSFGNWKLNRQRSLAIDLAGIQLTCALDCSTHASEWRRSTKLRRPLVLQLCSIWTICTRFSKGVAATCRSHPLTWTWSTSSSSRRSSTGSILPPCTLYCLYQFEF